MRKVLDDGWRVLLSRIDDEGGAEIFRPRKTVRADIQRDHPQSHRGRDHRRR
jgi:hypothetical protein